MLASFLFTLILASQPYSVRQSTASIRIDLLHPGPRVSPTLYGLFFEEINHAGDGGLYAEMVRNGSFEDGDGLPGWALVGRGAGDRCTVDTTIPMNQHNIHSLKLEALANTGGPMGVRTSGFWSIAVRKGQNYRVSLYARSSDIRGVSVGLTDRGGILPYNVTKIGGISPDWRQFTCTIVPGGHDPDAELLVQCEGKGTLWLDDISMIPETTWKKRPNRLRTDLAEKLDAIKPAFVRFPGGCYCEGEVLKDRFNWKDSIGPLEKRPGHWNLWGYRSTDHLGYHEYLQMCEDLGAEPLFVINCGMSHREFQPLDKLDSYVQDALDAIEYANDPVTSKWGALRAKAGHPKPFNLKFMEIGNENGWGNTLKAYEDRYARFHDAIKAKYPYVKLVANVPIRNRPMDIVDEHYYSHPEWFVTNSTKYDSYDRKGPKVYVGEYAVTQGCGQGNLRAAVAEAAFMCGLERNSDIVSMASYAPLFVNVNDRKWNPDAICFDSSRSFGTPSYWVQQVFSRNRSDVVLPCTVKTESKLVVHNGKIGLGTWLTQAEYKDVKVTSGTQALFSFDFSSGAPGWKVFKGNWNAADGVYRQSSNGDDIRSTAGDTSWVDYTYSLKARKVSGAEGFLIMFRARDDNNWYWWNIGGWGNSRHAIEKCVGGSKSIVGNDVPGRIESGRWYDIRVELAGPHIRCYLDGKLIHDVEERGAPAITAMAGRSHKTGEVILKVVNTSGQDQETEIHLDGAGSMAGSGAAVVLTSANPNDENSLTDPLKIAPKSSKVTGIGPNFRRTFPANSVTILRFKAKT